MTSEMIARIDAWIAQQPGYVSRQDAVRQCVDLTLGQPSLDREPGFPSEAPAEEYASSDAVD